jgi:precorrin-6Y C5,15-methyltransferase (decarboxylating)
VVIDVVGIQAGGWATLGEFERAVVTAADVLLGGPRHLTLVPPQGDQVRLALPSPLRPGLLDILAAYSDARVVVLASGDPLLAGVGSTLVDLLGASQVRVHPAVSSVALARARMGWSSDSVDVVRLVEPGASLVRGLLAPGRRLVVLSRDDTSAAAVAATLTDAGFGDSRMTVFADLGAGSETSWAEAAARWGSRPVPRLNLICVDCVPTVASPTWSPAPGLPDEAFENDGQLTKRDVRASALAQLRPVPGQLLWDLGAGAGSVAIEWARMNPRCRAVAVERDPDRADRIRRNADRLGVPAVRVVIGEAAAVLAELPPPDAIFIGGGVSGALIDRGWAALSGGGRLVAHAVTVESERVLLDAWRRLGGELSRISVERMEAIGSLHGWRPARAVVQWSITRPMPAPSDPTVPHTRTGDEQA